jgi:hypothetical protein
VNELSFRQAIFVGAALGERLVDGWRKSIE